MLMDTGYFSQINKLKKSQKQNEFKSIKLNA